MSRYEHVPQHDSVDGDYPPSAASSKFPYTPSRHSSTPSINVAERPTQPRTFVPLFLQTWFILTISTAMIILAAGVEVALFRSNEKQGWRIAGIGLLGGINFLKSVVPVILTSPIVFFWNSVDRDIGSYQPYINLAKGRAPADRSLLLDYTQGRTSTIYKSIRYGHWTVLLSSLVCLTSLILSPVSAGLLTTHNAIIITSPIQIDSIKYLGLDPDYVTLEYFNAAAGYSMAAAINNLTDPPFVFNGNWAIAEFKIPSPVGAGLNETVFVPTTGIESTAGCEPADTIDVNSAVAIGDNMTITGTWDSCTVTFGANHTGVDGYGVVPLGDCATHPEQPPFRPVLFWIYSAELNKADLTFCKPSIELWNVVAEASIITGNIVNVTLIDQNVPANNISGAPMNGVPFNGVEFDTDGQNKYVQARALAIQTGVAGAVYRGADQYGGATAVMQQDNGFLNITENVYNRFLALVAKSTYFNDYESTIQATAHSFETRLAVYDMAAHAFAGALAFIAILGAFNHLRYRKERAETPLAVEPTTIAAVVSTTSTSKFAPSLLGGMDGKEIENALRGRTFGISKRTWQIEAAGDEEDSLLQRKPPYELTLGKRGSVTSFDSGRTVGGPFSPELRTDGKYR